jgi:hypothetical protein
MLILLGFAIALVAIPNSFPYDSVLKYLNYAGMGLHMIQFGIGLSGAIDIINIMLYPNIIFQMYIQIYGISFYVPLILTFVFFVAGCATLLIIHFYADGVMRQKLAAKNSPGWYFKVPLKNQNVRHDNL